MVDAAERARDRGVNLAFFGGNTIYWQVRMEPSARGVQDRVMIGFKDVAKLDPVVDRRLATDKWRNVGRAEQLLLGVMFPQGAIGNNTDYRVSNSNHWIYAGTGLQNGDKIFKIIGYEIDGYDQRYGLPPHTSYTTLAASPFYGRKSRQYTADTTLYATANGALIFAGATTSWSWGLDKVGYIDPRLQRMTANVLDRLGGTARAAAAHAMPITRPATPLVASQLTTLDCAAHAAQQVAGTDFETSPDNWQVTVAGQRYPALSPLDAAANPDTQAGTAQREPLRALEETGCGHALRLTGPAGQPLQLYQEGLQLNAGQQYRLQVALSTDEAGRVSLYLVDPEQGYRNLGVASATFAVKAGWRRYYVDFTATNFEGTIDNARLLLLFHPNSAVDPGNTTAGRQVNYLVDEISLLPIAHYAADDDPLRLYSWRDYDEEIEDTNQLMAHVSVAVGGATVNLGAGIPVVLQDLESGGLLYQDVAETNGEGRVHFADVPLGEYLLLVEPVAGYLTPEPVWVAVAPDRVNDVDVTVTQTADAIYLPLILR